MFIGAFWLMNSSLLTVLVGTFNSQSLGLWGPQALLPYAQLRRQCRGYNDSAQDGTTHFSVSKSGFPVAREPIDTSKHDCVVCLKLFFSTFNVFFYHSRRGKKKQALRKYK